MFDYLNPFSDNFILKGVLDFLGSIFNYLNPFSEDFILKGVLDFLGNILSYLNPFDENFLGYKLIELLGDLLEWLFVPSGDILGGLQQSISNKFGFVNSIKLGIDALENNLNNDVSGTSSFTVDIDSKYFEGEVELFNLEWYKPFKPYGDLVFTGFAYILFLWRVFKALPSIIGGFEGFGRGGAD